MISISRSMITRSRYKSGRRLKGFSLVEVVVAVGIFALAIVGVIGLLGPTSKNISDVADSDAASRVITAIQSQLQAAGFDSVRASVVAGTTYFSNKDGSRVGADGAAAWTGISDTEKFFEFKLIRNGDTPALGDGLSPAANDTTAGFLAFTIVLKWPAYAQTGETTATRITNDAQKSVMVVPAAVTR